MRTYRSHLQPQAQPFSHAMYYCNYTVANESMRHNIRAQGQCHSPCEAAAAAAAAAAELPPTPLDAAAAAAAAATELPLPPAATNVGMLRVLPTYMKLPASGLVSAGS